jgi:hypothetical protein
MCFVCDSAVRGNIGVMVFTFPLFSIGFLIPALIQFGLSWAAESNHHTPFASQTFWRIVIGLVHPCINIESCLSNIRRNPLPT